MSESEEVPGLSVTLDKLVYHEDAQLPPERPHAFIYYLTIRNLSERTVTILGRKWVLRGEEGTMEVIEGDKVVGKTPELAPGEQFSYNSYHVVAGPTQVEGAFHGMDEGGRRIHLRIPAFSLEIPG